MRPNELPFAGMTRRQMRARLKQISRSGHLPEEDAERADIRACCALLGGALRGKGGTPLAAPWTLLPVLP